MEYHKTQIEFVERKAFRDLPSAVKGDFFTLIHYCARKENGGAIIGCYAWSDKDWASETNFQIRKRSAAALVTAKLATWKGDDLYMEGYDLVGEVECRKNRERAKEWRDKKRTDNSTGTNTGTRTDTVRIAERTPYQSSPVQSSPVGVRSPQKTPLPFSKEQKTTSLEWLRSVLLELTIPAHASAVAEWLKYLTTGLHQPTRRECIAFLRWVVPLGKSQGVDVEYPRHAGDAAVRSWLETERARFCPPIQQVAK